MTYIIILYIKIYVNEYIDINGCSCIPIKLLQKEAARFHLHTIISQLMFKCMMTPPNSKCVLISIVKYVLFSE